MGMPALATALISGANRIPYNDDDPAVDFTFKWVPEIQGNLTVLTNALADDFDRAGLAICAEPEAEVADSAGAASSRHMMLCARGVPTPARSPAVRCASTGHPSLVPP